MKQMIQDKIQDQVLKLRAQIDAKWDAKNLEKKLKAAKTDVIGKTLSFFQIPTQAEVKRLATKVARLEKQLKTKKRA